MDDFRDVAGLLLPHKVRRTSWWKEGAIGLETIAGVNEYRLNDPANTPERYSMRWPEGISVTDFRSGVRFVAQNGRLVSRDGRIVQETREATVEEAGSDGRGAAGLLAAGDSNGVNVVEEDQGAGANELDTAEGLAVPSRSNHWLWAVGGIALLGVSVAVFAHLRGSRR